MTGGSWMTSRFSDLGAGQFDGAWLVQNFENLNPANTYWTKQYRLYANVDTEAERYLEFERWWGGHVVLGGEEIQYIVDNLFVGNRLSTAQMVTSDGGERSEEHTSELQSRPHLVCRLLLEKKNPHPSSRRARYG